MLRRSIASFAKVRVPLKEVPFVTRKVFNAFTCPLPPPLPPHTNANRPTLVLGVEKVLLAPHTVRRRSQVTLRPYVTEFLTEVMQLYEVVFWQSNWGPSSTYGAMHLLESVLKLPHSTVYNPHTKVPFVADKGTQHVPPHFYALTGGEVIQSIQGKENVTFLPVLGRLVSRVVVLDWYSNSFALSPRNGIWCPIFESPSQDFIDDAVKQGCVTPISEYEGELDTDLWKPNPAKEERGWPQEVSQLPTDTALLDLLPMLRKVAAAQDVTRELDHWRHAYYTTCDDLDWNLRSGDGWRMLGDTTVHALGKERSAKACDMRNATPIPPLVLTEKSTQLLCEASRLLLTDYATAVSNAAPSAVSTTVEDAEHGGPGSNERKAAADSVPPAATQSPGGEDKRPQQCSSAAKEEGQGTPHTPTTTSTTTTASPPHRTERQKKSRGQRKPKRKGAGSAARSKV